MNLKIRKTAKQSFIILSIKRVIFNLHHDNYNLDISYRGKKIYSEHTKF